MLVLARRLIILVSLMGLSLTALSSEPGAQGLNCAPHDRLVQSLEKRYGEQPIGAGVTNNGKLMEVLTSPSGSWSVIVSSPNGISCLVAAGEGWRHILPESVKDPLAKGFSSSLLQDQIRSASAGL
ncbi:MAG: hypothetical protein R3245_10205 [Kiloniellales bacterium]|nr:hypothetical protein [Kiloniellales bacterium]